MKLGYGGTCAGAALGAVLMATSGCSPAALAMIGMLEEPVVAPEPTVARVVVVQYAGPGARDPEDSVPRASSKDHPPPDPVPFRLGAGRGVLGRLDLAPCREQGLPQGYLHMRVTFHHSGQVVRASVESPAPPPDEALNCISEQLQAVAMVPAFDGGDVTISKSYFVN